MKTTKNGAPAGARPAAGRGGATGGAPGRPGEPDEKAIFCRVPADVHAALSRRAASEDRSLGAAVRRILCAVAAGGDGRAADGDGEAADGA